jgi:DNA (cytosine-5)-methyltransferase 1|tara:strand:+ start:377 stop:1336 length:960 start_codon:yes stop_codon:yes gene_type:complete
MKQVLDLFSGIGGFSLGLERTGGFETAAFCEIDPYARAVLNKHWPEVPCYEDVRTLTADRLGADGIAVDVICGGFPCQDISTAGKGAGLAGERSGLWSEIARLVGELRPSYVIVENVSALLGRGLSRVLGDLSEIGYDAEWHCIPASYVGAPHRRDRVWIVAHPAQFPRDGGQHHREHGEKNSGEFGGGCGPDDVAYPDRKRLVEFRLGSQRNQGKTQSWIGNCGQNVANSISARLEGHAGDGANKNQPGRLRTPEDGSISQSRLFRAGLPQRRWEPEPDVGRVAHGVPKRVDRLKCLGNAVVPQIPEMIGMAILASLE